MGSAFLDRDEQYISRTDEQFEIWGKMRKEFKRRQREDRMLNTFWRRNKTFPALFGCEEETPGIEGTLEFWRSVIKKSISEGWLTDGSILEVLR